MNDCGPCRDCADRLPACECDFDDGDHRRSCWFVRDCEHERQRKEREGFAWDIDDARKEVPF